MAYQIYSADGTLFATINDGTLNTSSSMTLVGKNWAGYGAYLDTNFLHLMQNFSNSSAPTAPVTGQLYWNNSANTLSIYNGSTWKPFSSSTSSPNAPASGNVVGDLWYNTTAQTLNVYNGSTWLVVGPSVTNGTGAQTTVITDNVSTNHSVIELLVGTNVVGIISQDAFTPATPIPGFANVQPGLNLSSNIGGAGTAAGTVTSWINVLGYANIGGNLSVAGNVTGQYLLGNGTFISGNIGGGSANINANSGTFSGNVTVANLVPGKIYANGSYGNSGEVLTSAGPNANVYWANATGGGGGNTGAGGAITLNTNVINVAYTIPTGFNGVTAGPITLGTAGNIIISPGSAWSIV